MQSNAITTIQLFERMILRVFVGIVIFMAFFLLLGDKTFPKVTKVNINNETVLASQRQIVFTFNRNMNRKSVEENFSVIPAVEGTLSWSGKNFAFTPLASFPYGKRFQIKINNEAKDEDGKTLDKNFVYNFQTDNLRFAYLATDGDYAQDIVISNLKGEDLLVLPTRDYEMESFEVAPDGKKIYFLGKHQNQDNAELFQIGLHDKKITQLTEEKGFLNKAFQLSPDGRYLTLSRVEMSLNGEIASSIQLWLASTKDFQFKKFKSGRGAGLTPIFTFDGTSLLYQNTEGNYELGIVDENVQDEPIFIGEYNEAYGFHPFKPLIAFTKYAEGDVFSLNNFLMLFNGDGTKITLPFGEGIARDTVFTSNGKKVLSIFSGPQDEFNDVGSFFPLRIFHLYSYDLESRELLQLTNDIGYSEEMPVISPDSRNLLFLRFDTADGNKMIDPAYRDMAASLGSIENGGEIWLMDLVTGQMDSLGVRASKIQFFQ